MSNFKFDIMGDKELLAALARSAKEEAVKEVVKRNTASMQQQAMKKAPVDTGYLKQNIEIEILKDGAVGKVTSAAEYAGYVENGTRFMAAQPYMGPAFRFQRPIFISDLRKLVE